MLFFWRSQIERTEPGADELSSHLFREIKRLLRVTNFEYQIRINPRGGLLFSSPNSNEDKAPKVPG